MTGEPTLMQRVMHKGNPRVIVRIDRMKMIATLKPVDWGDRPDEERDWDFSEETPWSEFDL